MMRRLYKHDSNKLKIQVQEALANNDRLVITGTSGGIAANRMLMMSAALVNSPLNEIPDTKKRVLLDELALLLGRDKSLS